MPLGRAPGAYTSRLPVYAIAEHEDAATFAVNLVAQYSPQPYVRVHSASTTRRFTHATPFASVEIKLRKADHSSPGEPNVIVRTSGSPRRCVGAPPAPIARHRAGGAPISARRRR